MLYPPKGYPEIIATTPHLHRPLARCLCGPLFSYITPPLSAELTRGRRTRLLACGGILGVQLDVVVVDLVADGRVDSCAPHDGTDGAEGDADAGLAD